MTGMLAASGTDPMLFAELGAVLLTLAVAARLSDSLGFSPIPLYLLAGLVLGALADGPITFDDEVVAIGADIGLVLLLFMLGLEYTGSELTGHLRSSYRSGVVDLVLNFTPGFIAGLLLDWGLTAALLLGAVTYISSSGIVSKVIRDLARDGHHETPVLLSILVMEDLAMAFMLPLFAVLLATSAPVTGALLAALAVASAVAALAFATRYGHAFSRRIASRSDEVLLLTTLGFVLLMAGGAAALQLSAAVGAFLAGIVLYGPAAEQARPLFSPLRDLFAAIFFVFFGLNIDVAAIPPVVAVALGLAVLTAATKVITGWIAARSAGADLPGRMRAGTALIARGEFSIVVAGLGVSAGLHPDLGPLAAAYVLITALAGSVITRWAEPLAERLVLRRGGAPPRPAGS